MFLHWSSVVKIQLNKIELETRPAVGQGRMCGPGHGKRSDWRLVAPLPPGSKYWGKYFQRSDPRTGKETWLQEQGLICQWNLKTLLFKSDWSINIKAMLKLRPSLHDKNYVTNVLQKNTLPWSFSHQILKYITHRGYLAAAPPNIWWFL